MFIQSMRLLKKTIFLGGFTAMKKAKLFSLGIVAVAGLTLLGACGGGNSGSTDSTGGGSETVRLMQRIVSQSLPISVGWMTVHSTNQRGKA